MSQPFDIRTLQFNFGVGGTTATTPSNLRASVTLKNAGGMSMVSAEGRIWGLTRSLMNQITTLGKNTWVGRVDNTIEIIAGDSSGTSTVFRGILNQAFATPDAPDVPTYFQAFEGIDDALKPVPPTSVKGASDIASIFQGLASNMGLQFQNNGVSGVQINNVYLSGTYLQQVQTLANATQSTPKAIEYEIANGTLSIWPQGGTKSNATSFTIDPDHTLVGSPTYTSYGLIVTALFNPGITRGSIINLTSNIFPNANNTWGVIQVDHELETQIPGGKWFTRLMLATPANAGVVNT